MASSSRRGLRRQLARTARPRRPARAAARCSRHRRSGASAIERRVGTRPASAPSSGPEHAAPPTTAASAQLSGSASGERRPSASSAAEAGTTSARRRLSLIFHEPSASMPKRRGAQHQRQQLPVAARPAVHARGGDAGVVRMVFDQHHVAHARRSARPLPSSRSWLSTAPSGSRRSSTACTACTLSRPLPVKEPVPNTSW